METPVKSYKLGDKTYEQRPLVLAQWRQLQVVLDGLEVPEDAEAIKGLVTALGKSGRLDEALAILLTERGVALRDKDRTALAEGLAYVVDPNDVAKVFIDFFDYNPANSVLSAMAGVMMALTRCIERAAREASSTGSSTSVSSSPEGTGPNETTSSGDALPQDPCPGSDTESQSSCSEKP